MKHSEAKQGRILVIRLKEHFRSAFHYPDIL
jgi:hypothetical protein